VQITAGAVALRRVRFVANAASAGGAIEASGGSLVLDSVQFILNSATANGGAISAGCSDVIGSDVTFESNAVRTGAGGAIFQSSGGLRLADCAFANNTSNDAGARGSSWACLILILSFLGFSDPPPQAVRSK
jgi:predicted outer membrane repeat protein